MRRITIARGASLLSRFSNYLYSSINKYVLIAAVVIFILFMILVLPDMAGRLAAMTGVEKSPDTSFIYSADDLYTMAHSYGEQGRAYYIYQRFTFDLIWPVVYLFFFTALITSLFEQFPANSSLRMVNLLPLGGAFFDLLENSGASIVMYRYPLSSPVLSAVVPFFTFLKWIFIALGTVAVLYGIIVSLCFIAKSAK